jgi:hypothetical protein
VAGAATRYRVRTVSAARKTAEEGTEILKPVYQCFTEGLGTRDMREAKALLEELG